MSDFLLNVLNRHMGIGRRVRPRIRTRFERDVSVDSITDYDSEPDTDSGSVAKQSSRNVEPAEVSSPDEPAEIIEQEIMQRSRKKPHPEYVSKSVSKLPYMSDNSRQELVMQPGDVTGDVRAASENDTGKRPDDKVQKVQKASKRLVSAGKYYHSPGMKKPGKPINKATSINHKDFNNARSKQHQQVTSELSSDHFENNIRLEKSLLEPLPRTISRQNINFEPQYLLQTSLRLTGRRSEYHKDNVFLKDSKAETEPVTNVTIGRIEVRAIPPRSAEKTERKKKPSGIMSLDNYLSRQKQGGSR